MKFFKLALAVAAAAPALAFPVPQLGESNDGKPVLLIPVNTPYSTEHTEHTEHHHHHKTHKPTTTAEATSVPNISTVPIAPTAASTSQSSAAATSAAEPATTNIPAETTTTTSTLGITSVALVPSASVSVTSGSSGMLRGVNVGNWLILEKFMDDGSVFTGKYASAADQWAYDSIDNDGADIKKHWDSWFTESDVQKLASFGFNALRIPIGYWAFNNSGTPYTTGAADYLDKAIEWARSSGMKVLVDCHGSPGSQNGQEHSGHQGSVDWQQNDNLDFSTRILQTMIQRYGGKDNSDVVWGIETVNEPTADSPNSFSTSQSWATQTYNTLQQTISENGLNSDIQIITHDSFMGPTKFVPLLSDVRSAVNTPTFGVDQHNYQLYDDSDNSEDQPSHIKEACGWGPDLATTKQSMPVVVGEWSALTNICVKSDGSTYGTESCDGSGNCATCPTNTWTPALVEQVRKFVEAQLDTFEANSNGHFIWNFKSGTNSGWSVYDLIEVKAFPSPITDRQYSPQCS